ncbi:MAG TPA: metal ABC transporter permease [Candidatus Brocadiia bacterium]|nr:metal ABC transporter permease [Candidatus Brocadiia bacterium]
MRTFLDLCASFPCAVAAGVLLGAVCPMLGVFVILKRVVFIGAALSEVAALGVAAAMVCGAPPYLGAAAATLAAAALLSRPFENTRLPRDAVLGLVFVLASALSVLLVARSGFGLHEVRSLLYGDLVLASRADLAVVACVLVPVAAWLLVFLRPTLYAFLDREAARVLGVHVVFWEMAFFACLGLAVSAASRTAGALLVFCYLVAAPAAALLVARRLWLALAVAAAMGVTATLTGLWVSFATDAPANPVIAACAGAGFALALLFRAAAWLIARVRRP